MKHVSRNTLVCLVLGVALAPSSSRMAFAADPPIVHQITLTNGQTWCDDSMINGLFDQVNALRSQAGVPVLTMSTLGMKDAEIRATQFATYMMNTPPGPGFNPHDGWDTTAASLGYNIVGENLAYISTDPAYIVQAIWQDSLHLAAMLTTGANVMGVSCIYDSGTAFWTYEPGACTGSGCGTPPPQPPPQPPPPSPPPPTSPPTLDSEEWGFLTLINNFRAQNGVGPLQVSLTLETASKWMSTDMATNNYFSHTDSLGRSTGARLAAFGYSYTPWGENLAAGYSDAQTTFNQFATACDPDASGNCTYGHRQNMLGAGYNAIGIARASGGSYGWYWTTDFGGYLDQGVLPTGQGPTIASFTATPSSVAAGQSTSLSWSVSGASSVAIDNGVGDVSTVTSKTVFPSQTTTYTLTATNSAGSSVSRVTVTVTTPKDTQPPSAPVLTSAVAKNSNEVDLAWTASTDNVGVTGYQVLRSGLILITLSGTTLSYADTAAAPSTTYAYSVRAFDAAGNISPASNSIQVVTPAATPGPPVATGCSTIPTGAFIGCYYNNITLSGAPSFIRTDSQINFDWSGNVPDRSVGRGSFSVRWQGNFVFDQGTYTFSTVSSDGIRLYIDGSLVLDRWIDQTPTLNTVQQTLSQGVHLITLEYYERTGWSVAHLTWQGSAPVVQAPSILSFSATPSTVTVGQPTTLTWSVGGPATLAIDNGVGDVSGTTSKAIVPGQTTTYTLTATNSAGSSTARVTVTVNSAGDTQPPSIPNLAPAMAKSSNEVDLAWTPSVDNVAVAGYQIIRNGSVIGSVPGLSYADVAVSPNTSYTYSIKAYDAAGNYSAASNLSQVTTPPAPVSTGTCPTTAVGAFTGCYYSNISLSGTPALVRTDPQINFDWGGNPPDRSVGRSGFSARWQGSFNFAQGAYTFSAMTSDGMRVYVDGSLILDRWSDQAATQYTVQQTLSQGLHAITVEYYENTGWSTAHLTWQKN
jgi:uncharacterized protein YkwD/chitodextrinase